MFPHCFHPRTGTLISLSSDRLTASRDRPLEEFNNGLTFSDLPITSGEYFEVEITNKVPSWQGNLEIGVTGLDPARIRSSLPANAAGLVQSTWIMSGCSIMRNGTPALDDYHYDLNNLKEKDRIGVMRSTSGELHISINGVDMGPADVDLPDQVWAVIDLYGKCCKVSVVSQGTPPAPSSPALSSAVTTTAAASKPPVTMHPLLLVSSSLNPLPDLPPVPAPLLLTFHTHCGTQILLTESGRCAERRRPLEEFNNAVAVTSRPLRHGEYFEVCIDALVDKWSGSVEIGVTSHDPDILLLPATMTNLRSGTIMMSGNGILTNGRANRDQYTSMNLDYLKVSDTIGLVVRHDGELHFCYNRVDLGVAALLEPGQRLWGVVDLYGRTVKATIIDPPDPRRPMVEQPLTTNRDSPFYLSRLEVLASQEPMSDDEDNAEDSEKLVFFQQCGSNVSITNGNKTCTRMNNDEFNNGVAVTNRTLRTGEIFTVHIDKIVDRWAGGLEIGVTSLSPQSLPFPTTMTDITIGKTYMLTSNGVMFNGALLCDGDNRSRDESGGVLTGVYGLTVGQSLGVELRANRKLHFYLDGRDLGSIPGYVPPAMYGVVDLYGQAARVTIISAEEALSSAPVLPAPVSSMLSVEGVESSPSAVDLDPEPGDIVTRFTFHALHGRNVTLDSTQRVAFRPNATNEFKNALVMSSHPLEDDVLFEVEIDGMVDRWSGSLEAGVTSIQPEEMVFPETLSHLDSGTWVLSGSCVMKNGSTARNDYDLDMDNLTTGSRVGIMRRSNGALHFFWDGYDMGPANTGLPKGVYAILDLYGQCSKVSLSPDCGIRLANCSATPSLLRGNFQAVGALGRAIQEMQRERTDEPSWEVFHRAIELLRNNLGSTMNMMLGGGESSNRRSSSTDNLPSLENLRPRWLRVLSLFSTGGQTAANDTQQTSSIGAEASLLPTNQTSSVTSRLLGAEETSNGPINSTQPASSLNSLKWNTVCGINIKVDLKNGSRNQTALDHALLFSDDPIHPDELYEISLSCERPGISLLRGAATIGLVEWVVTKADEDPSNTTLTSSALQLKCPHWLVSDGKVIVCGTTQQHNYASAMQRNQTRLKLGLLYSAEGSMTIFVDGVNMGVAADSIPKNCFLVLDLNGLYTCAVLSNVIRPFRLPTNPPTPPVHSQQTVIVSDATATPAISSVQPLEESATLPEDDSDLSNNKLAVELSNAQTQQQLHQSTTDLPSDVTDCQEVEVATGDDHSSPHSEEEAGHVFSSVGLSRCVQLTRSDRCVDRNGVGFDGACVLSQSPLTSLDPFLIRIDELVAPNNTTTTPATTSQWSGSLCLALLPCSPEHLQPGKVLPPLLQEMDTLLPAGMCGIYLQGSCLYMGRNKLRGNLSADLDAVAKGDVIGFTIENKCRDPANPTLGATNIVRLTINGSEVDTIYDETTTYRPLANLYPALALYGQLRKVTLLSQKEARQHLRHQPALATASASGDTVITTGREEKGDVDLVVKEKQRRVIIVAQWDAAEVNSTGSPEQTNQIAPSTADNHGATNQGSVAGCGTALIQQQLTTSGGGNECEYHSLSDLVRRGLCLPEAHFRAKHGLCLCRECLQRRGLLSAGVAEVKEDQVGGVKDSPLQLGWVKYALRLKRDTRGTISRWHTAYMHVPPKNIRTLLDIGDPTLLSPETDSNCSLSWLRGDLPTFANHHRLSSGQGDELPDTPGHPVSLLAQCPTSAINSQTISFTNSGKSQQASCMFEVRVKPNSYVVSETNQSASSDLLSQSTTLTSSPQNESQASPPIEWITKERGACVLTALLIHIE